VEERKKVLVSADEMNAAASPTGLLVLAALAALVAGACDRRRPPIKAPPSTVPLGSCADPRRDGILGERPALRRADRDLDGDRAVELVVADRNLCTADGNCYWNVYAPPAVSGPPGEPPCWRYLGTIAASGIDRLDSRGEDNFRDLRGWWTLSGGTRFLLQHYRYRHGGYRVVETMLCRQEGDDRLLCASDERSDPPP
jgi:hypothetical protein